MTKAIDVGLSKSKRPFVVSRKTKTTRKASLFNGARNHAEGWSSGNNNIDVESVQGNLLSKISLSKCYYLVFHALSVTLYSIVVIFQKCCDVIYFSQ